MWAIPPSALYPARSKCQRTHPLWHTPCIISFTTVYSCLFCKGTCDNLADLYAHLLDTHRSEQRLTVETDGMFPSSVSFPTLI
jgi:hypothetical protein